MLEIFSAVAVQKLLKFLSKELQCCHFAVGPQNFVAGFDYEQ